MADIYLVQTEEQAWHLLERWMRGQKLPPVDFSGWPILSVNMKGDEYNSSLNSSQMAALVHFKMTMGRSYAALAHGAYDMRRLKAEEEEDLDFSTTVHQGSSILDTDLSPLVRAVATAIDSHPATAVVAAVVLGLAFVSRPVILKHYENRAKQLEIEERRRLTDLALTGQEKAQFALFEAVLEKLSAQKPQIAQALPDMRNAFWRFASASTNADQLQVAGISFNQDDLEILSERRSRRPSNIREVHGVFRVLGIRKIKTRYSIQLESDELAVSAMYGRPQMTETRVGRLFRCMRSSGTITATIEVKTVDKAQLSARLLVFSVNQEDLE